MSMLLFLAACGGTEEETAPPAEQEEIVEEIPEETTENGEEGGNEELGYVHDYGTVTVLSEAEPFVLEGNESVDYELTNIKLVKIEDYTEDGEFQLMWGMGVDDVSELPESVYAVIGTETKKNNTDISIEFTGVHTLAAGSTQIDLITDDFVTEDNSGSTMLSGVEQESQFGVVVEDPDVENLTFVLSSAFDSETFAEDFLEEQEIQTTLVKK